MLNAAFQGFYSEKHAETYRSKLDQWKQKELTKYDEKPEYKEKKDAKHENRAGFEKWLDESCETNMAAVPVKPVAEW